MPDIQLPRILIVIQTIFGGPSQRKREFRSGDIDELTAEDLGRFNYSKPLDKLLELGWVERTEQRQTLTGGGRPSKYLYRQTHLGRQEYTKLKAILAKYGIQLL
jgi:hypothetical protein